MRPHIKTKQTIGKKEKNVLAVKLKTGFKISKNMSIKSGALGPCGAKYLS